MESIPLMLLLLLVADCGYNGVHSTLHYYYECFGYLPVAIVDVAQTVGHTNRKNLLRDLVATFHPLFFVLIFRLYIYVMLKICSQIII
jgi:hypothetical protein